MNLIQKLRGTAKMSIHDEQEIDRLRASSDELREALAVSERQLIDAMALLADSKPGKPDMLSCQIWRQRLARLQHECRHGAL